MEYEGTLKVRVYTSLGQIPVSGATVVVTGPGTGDKWVLWSVQETDRSGEIKPITIATPAPGQSEYPGGSGGYALCDVWAEHPGFALLRVEGVQVFPGVETLQGMELTPLSEGESSLEQTQVNVIPGQSL